MYKSCIKDFHKGFFLGRELGGGTWLAYIYAWMGAYPPRIWVTIEAYNTEKARKSNCRVHAKT